MGRGVSSGGGQSSLGYLFGGNEAPAPRPAATNVEAPPRNSAPPASAVVADKSSAVAPSGGDAPKQIPAGIQGSQSNNNYFRADGQNTGNFLTDRPSTKVHAAPGGGSSLGYLFGDGK
ncbi:protein SPIRAL1-like 1 [Salvia hispanica]|uniref:protein SPIRAL1-like 1 n=1 Tax=Salvia hispanica TaxID=49212 RepID=UPI0020096CB0|nr:protein SPIRAL1-like 1 [Salvia hispanica]XP_047940545.1 protein SPIRAL1-like 1 [Salvia hispanica]XP_047940546.1 protein SPIRAL1-like 1 [Salvia hispanica]XP_047940547.1 protein SPIRAL1-like 1 [Salvia hispanica]XP_047940548.1 protein SPIRAL1-like 1 [Salvia hispanica]